MYVHFYIDSFITVRHSWVRVMSTVCRWWRAWRRQQRTTRAGRANTTPVTNPGSSRNKCASLDWRPLTSGQCKRHNRQRQSTRRISWRTTYKKTLWEKCRARSLLITQRLWRIHARQYLTWIKCYIKMKPRQEGFMHGTWIVNEMNVSHKNATEET